MQISSIQGNDNQIPSVTENILSIKLNNKVSLELVKVEAGSFTMSANDGENYENEVPHTATLTQDFYIGKYEVTQEQWEAVMGSNPSKFKGDKLPMECVSWHDAMNFCEKLNKSGKAPIGYHFTLPTETQWEYAAKGGKKSKGYKYSGSNTAGEVAWYDENSGDKTHEVGTKKTNELGLYDMSGNVLEWCLDDWTSYSSEAKAEFTRGKDSSSSGRVSRGGSWCNFAWICRAVNRRRNAPSFTLSHIGFRVALAPVEYRNAEEKQTPSKQSTEAPSETAENETDEENIQVIELNLNNKVSLELVKVEAESYTMSANDGENYENEVPHTATLTQDYYIGKYEVTQEQWDSVMGSNPSYFKGDKLPVEQVSWYDAMDFCEKLNKSGKAPIGYHFTLPTETQWEYASKGGKKSKGYKYSGNDTLDEVGWYYENSGDKKLDDSKWDVEQLLKNNCKTHEAGMKAPNELGLYDMSGNVLEWCLDDWTDDSSEAKAEFTRGKDSSSSDRVFRGGGWYYDAMICRAAFRGISDPSGTCDYLGFRVALAPEKYSNAEEKQTPSKQSTEIPSETAENETDEEIQVIELNLNNKVSLELVKVEAGSFTMSANDGENYSNEKSHTATLTQDYYIGKYEVTQEQWESVMGGNPSNFKGDKLPVEDVSWHDAMDFCEKLNKSGKAPSGYHFTLPTETQWEYASKGGKKSEGYKYSGSDTLDEVGWYYENSGSKTHEVGTKKTNELGLYDMSGNVWEWCLDDWTDDSREAKAEFTRGKDSSSSFRVCRGGSWDSFARFCRAAYRSCCDPSDSISFLGFRVALVPEKYRNAEETQAPSKQSTEIPSETAENETDEENIQVIKLNNKVSLELVKVEAGSFTMSANDGENYENEVPHTATLTQDYYIGKYEVTQEQWDSVMGSNPSYFKGDKLPVEQVSWYDAMDFCEKLNKSGKAPSGYHFTLPTETQWEYASKGGKKSKGYKYSGNDTLDEVGWYYENSGDKKLDDSKWDVEQLLKNNSKTHEVGTKKANELGLYDMSGNVWEWCLDDYTDDSSKAKAEFTRGKDSSSSDRVYRGGGWSNIARSCRAACRSSGVPSNASLGLGFRVVLAPGQN